MKLIAILGIETRDFKECAGVSPPLSSLLLRICSVGNGPARKVRRLSIIVSKNLLVNNNIVTCTE